MLILHSKKKRSIIVDFATMDEGERSRRTRNPKVGGWAELWSFRWFVEDERRWGVRSKTDRGCFSPQPEGSFSADRDAGDEDMEQRENVVVMQPLSTAFRAQ